MYISIYKVVIFFSIFQPFLVQKIAINSLLPKFLMPPRSLRDRMKAGFSFSSLPIQQSAKCTFSRCLYSFSFLPVPLLNTDLFLSEEVFLSHLPLPWFPQQELFLKYPSVRHCCSAELQRLLRTPDSAVVGGTYSRMPWTWHTITCPLIKH